jgi:hypothetical protein
VVAVLIFLAGVGPRGTADYMEQQPFHKQGQSSDSEVAPKNSFISQLGGASSSTCDF